jgi:hypothetical protein
MTGSQNHPREFDAIRGGDAPPLLGAVLGGVEGVKLRLASSDIETRIDALSRALNYGDAGLNLVIKALEDNSAKVRKTAVSLLKDIDNSQVKAALKEYKFWTTFEKYYDIPRNHATTFANRKVIECDPNIGITDTVDTAYALRVVPGENYYTKLQILLQSPKASKVEALVFGFWYTTYFEYYNLCHAIDLLLQYHEKFTNVKALFLGDVNNNRWEDIQFSYNNICYVLLAYPQLEVLKIRISHYHRFYHIWRVEFSHIRHEKLKALIIEGCDIATSVIEEIFKLELPDLEYLELWLDINDYDVSEFNFHNKFPKLKYLGIHSYNNDSEHINIYFAIINSLEIENLVELDLSRGAMQDETAKYLFNCPAVRQLDTLNVSYNCLTDGMIEKFNQLNIEVIAEKQEPYRYWSTYE